jgi:D-glycero-alpha-D-manno-heptose-7-phosphate kinase
MLIRSKAPLRLGLAGGGTDVSPYSDLFGGGILNATINLYAYATIEPTHDGKVVFETADGSLIKSFNSKSEIKPEGIFDIHAGIFNRMLKQFPDKELSFRLITSIDAPQQSGLGTSSTLAVAILGAFVEWLKLPLGEYDIAQMAYEIERFDLGMAGGKQDQYSATFGGINFMEFSKDKVIVNPLRIKDSYLDELAHNLVLYYTDTSRLSSQIIQKQQQNVLDEDKTAIEAMHQLKKQAVMMKEALLRGNLDEIGKILDFGWKFKKQMAAGITNNELDKIYDTAIANGATGGKISGAGGGGYMFFYCPGNARYQVIEALKQFGGYTERYEFTSDGLVTWTL